MPLVITEQQYNRINNHILKLEKLITSLEVNKKFNVNKSRLKNFFYTMYERQQIWYKRFILKLPQEEWTNDKYYSQYRFTNVYRELDRASQFLLKNIILNNSCWHKYKKDDDNYINLLWKMLFFRMINNPCVFTSADVISDYNKYDPNKFYDYLKKEIIANDIPFAHGAFCQYSQHEIVNDNGKKIAFDNMGEYFAKYTLVKLHDHIYEIYQFMKDSFTSESTADDFIDFMSDTIDGCGRFMAHEFFQDMCYIKQYIGLSLMNYDANSATNAGPGSSAGVKYIFKNVKSKQDVIDAICYLRSIAEECLSDMCKENFPDSDGFYYITWDADKHKYKHVSCNLTLNQIEMWLCEFYKYIKYSTSKDKSVRVRNYHNEKSADDLLY